MNLFAKFGNPGVYYGRLFSCYDSTECVGLDYACSVPHDLWVVLFGISESFHKFHGATIIITFQMF